MYSAIAQNKRNTVVIMFVFVTIIALIGWAFSAYFKSTGIFWWSLVGVAVYTLVQYFVADKLALAMNGAKEITKHDNPRLWRTVENLAIANGMPMPKLYVVEDPAPNAFATGRDPEHAHVAATTGLLEIMTDTELQGVMAHELSHVKNYDIRVSMIAFGLVSVIGLLADLFVRMMWFGGDGEDRPSSPALIFAGVAAAVLAPIVAMLIQAAISRQREYLADASGAQLTHYPDGLAHALAKLGNVSTATARQNTSTAHLYFANPLKGKNIMELFSTHPALEDRIARLRDMGGKF